MPANPTAKAASLLFSPGEIDWSAVTAFARACRPIMSSAIKAGYSKAKASTRETNRNAAPPLEAALVGKPQMLPSPTAEPDAAIRNPNLDENSPLGAAMI